MKCNPVRGLLLLAVFVAGCDHDVFEVEIRPEGQQFQRTLTCWHVGQDDKEVRPLSQEQLACIGKLYQKQEAIEGGKKHVFTGRFDATTPADVGGAGTYTCFASPLGSTFSYIERFRGNDDLEGELSERRRAADQLTDLLLGWLQSELGREPGFDRLRQFIDKDLRRDLKNLGMYAWTGSAVADCTRQGNGEFLARAGQYLYERGYLKPQEIPALARAITAGDATPLLKHVRRLLARKMDLPDDQPVPKSFDFLADPQRLDASLHKYVRTTEAYKQRLREWEKQKQTRPDAKEPAPGDLLGELAGGAFRLSGWFVLFASEDTMRLKLHCVQQPYATNGKWEEQAGAVVWSHALHKERVLPAFCFALGSVPDKGFQQAHFGGVLLADMPLAQYVTWYGGLKPAEAQEWDRFVAGLKPGAGLRPAVELFRFSTDRKGDPQKPDEKPSSLADTPRRLILEALEKQ